MSASNRLFCLTCGTAGVPREPASALSRHGTKVALALVSAYLVWRFQPQMWWIAAVSALPAVFELFFGAPDAPRCAKCGSTSLIPVDSPRAQRELHEQEKAADRAIAEHDSGQDPS
jgi:hypothetical protein